MSGTAIVFILVGFVALILAIAGVAARNRQKRDDRDGGLHADTGRDDDGGGDSGGDGGGGD